MSLTDWKITELEDFIAAGLKIYSDQVDRTIKINFGCNLLGITEVLFFVSPPDPYFDLIVRYGELAMSVILFLLVETLAEKLYIVLEL